jgi:phosphate transport system substrate-binding protein
MISIPYTSRFRPVIAVLILAMLALAAAGCSSGEPVVPGEDQSGGRVKLNGAGSTFVFPMLSKWTSVYDSVREGTRINYQSIGSGGGIRQVIAGTVDFGATDGPMTDEQLQDTEKPILHVPVVMGAVVPAYNLPGKKAINFSGPVLADIFLGKITKWNDPALAELNPGVKLPDQPIVVVRRADGSGTTYIWVDYLAKVSPQWQKKVGVGTSVRWPVGLGSKGNEGVAGQLKRIPGSIGYLELVYALQNNIPYGKVRNREGRLIKASPETVSAAGAGAVDSIPADLRVSITDAAGKNSYPISGFVWLLVHEDQRSEAKGREMADFLWWVTHEGQEFTEALDYAPIPQEVVRLAEDKIKAMNYQGQAFIRAERE